MGMKVEYWQNHELFKEKLKASMSEYRSELINLIKSESKTYFDVDRKIRVIKQDATFHNNQFLMALISEVENYFDNEKGNLLLK